jgi:nucleotide-binding universal stress UspA family protein
MYRSILVPLDGSTFGEQALSLACEIARRSCATLHLVHVHLPHTPNPIYVEGMPVIDDQLRSLGWEHERNYLERIRERLAVETKGTITATLLDMPNPSAHDRTVAQVLAAHVIETGADLVVMTTHGRGGLARFWLGSVADGLLRWSAAPILLLRPDEDMPDPDRSRAIQRILIPLDGSARSEAIVEHALALGRLGQAEYTLLRVVPPFILGDAALLTTPADFDPERTMRRYAEAQHELDSVAQRLQTAGAQVGTRVLIAEQVAATILEDAGQHAIDLIALSTHGRRGLARLLIGSVADKVLRGAETLVLVYRPPAPDDSA